MIDVQFAPNVPWAWKSFQAHPMVPLGDIGQVEARLGQFEDSVNPGARQVYGLRRMYHGHRKLLRHTRMYF
jgi:hypothetical protein